MTTELSVALIGATGIVGAELIQCLQERNFPVRDLQLFATQRSAGTQFKFRGETLTTRNIADASFHNTDIAFVSASTSASIELCPKIASQGAVAFDDSSAFRQKPNVPLVVPEINPEDLRKHRGIIATPNCTTVPLVLTLAPLMQKARVKRVIADTYQAVSGSGRAAVSELTDQITALSKGQEPQIHEYPKQIAYNAIPQVDVFLENGYTKEEWKMLHESRKILHTPDLQLSATCVRIPTAVSHAVAVHCDLDQPISPEHARELWNAQPGVSVIDGRVSGDYPTPLDATGINDVFVGRVRTDTTNLNGLVYWVVADNLRKGAALNMIQMAEWMLANGYL